MSKNAFVCPVDPHINIFGFLFPAGIMSQLITKDSNFIIKIIAHQGIMALEGMNKNIGDLLDRKDLTKETTDKIIEEIVSGKYPHGRGFCIEDLKQLDIPVEEKFPEEFSDLVV